MKTEFTPGPWKLSADSLFQEFVIVGASTLPVCSLLTAKSAKSASWSNKKVSPNQLWEGVADEREQANARLIAAAPDLAEQLDRCVRFLADLNGCDWIKGDDAGSVDMRNRAKALQSTARAAIAKTTCLD